MQKTKKRKKRLVHEEILENIDTYSVRYLRYGG